MNRPTARVGCAVRRDPVGVFLGNAGEISTAGVPPFIQQTLRFKAHEAALPAE